MHRMDRIYRIFSGEGGLAVLDIRKSAHLHRRSLPLVQQPPILIILCILCIHVQKLGREDLLFDPRMIRPVIGIGGGLVRKNPPC